MFYDELAKGFQTDNKDFILEGIEDMFQMEILAGEEVFACNICDEGFDTDDQVRKHIEILHKEILMQIKTNLDKEEVNSSDESLEHDRKNT